MALDEKHMVIGKLGWKRICRNTQKFGWALSEAIQHEEITETTSYEGEVINDKVYIKEKTNTSSKISIRLSFYRNTADYYNLQSISVIEKIYNFVFSIRMFIHNIFLLIAIGLFFSIVGNSEFLLVFCLSCVGVWLVFRKIENILANMAYRRLRRK